MDYSSHMPPIQSAPARLSKAQTLARVRSLKKYIVVASLLGFGTLSALVAGQLNATTASLDSGQPTIQAPSSSSDSGGFFNQQGGGYGFGSGNSQSAPFTRSGVS